MPKITSALADGAITPEHADAFIKAAKQTSAATVDDDSDLLAEAARLPADLAAARTAQWTRRHQSPDDIQSQFLRQRRLRSQRFYNDEDGMTVAKACFDTVLGASTGPSSTASPTGFTKQTEAATHQQAQPEPSISAAWMLWP